MGQLSCRGRSSQLCLAQPRKELELACEIGNQVTLQASERGGLFVYCNPRFPGSTLLRKTVHQGDFDPLFNGLDHIWTLVSIMLCLKLRKGLEPHIHN